MTEAGLDSASSDKYEPVLFVKNSTGSVFGDVSASGIDFLTVEDLPPSLPGRALIAFEGLDAAVNIGLRARPLDAAGAAALVLVQDWQGHDPALRGFNLMFVEHRLTALGFSTVRFADLSGAEDEMPDWAAELDIVQADRPVSGDDGPSGAPGNAHWPGTAALLISEGDAGTDGLIAAARSRLPAEGGRLLVVCDEGVSLPEDFPATTARFEAASVSPRWLVSRAGQVMATGRNGWRRAFADEARILGIPFSVLGGGSREERKAGAATYEKDYASWLMSLAGGRQPRPTEPEQVP